MAQKWFENGTKTTQKRPKKGQNGVKTTPKRPQTDAKTMPKWSPSDPKVTPHRPKIGLNQPQVTLKWSCFGPKMVQKWPYIVPDMVKNVSKGVKKWSKRAKMVQKSSTPSSNCLKTLKIHPACFQTHPLTAHVHRLKHRFWPFFLSKTSVL